MSGLTASGFPCSYSQMHAVLRAGLFYWYLSLHNFSVCTGKSSVHHVRLPGTPTLRAQAFHSIDSHTHWSTAQHADGQRASAMLMGRKAGTEAASSSCSGAYMMSSSPSWNRNAASRLPMLRTCPGHRSGAQVRTALNCSWLCTPTCGQYSVVTTQQARMRHETTWACSHHRARYQCSTCPR